MAEYFMRPVFVSSINPGQRAHCELWNPEGSGYRAIVDHAYISRASGVTVLRRGGPIMNNASFPESRGLPIYDNPLRPYASCHARYEVRTTTNEDGSGLIQGGQLFNHDTISGLVRLDFKNMVLGEGHSLMIRSNNDGQLLSVSFAWHEIKITTTATLKQWLGFTP